MCEPPSSFLMGFVFWDTGLSAVDPGLVSRPAGRPEFVVGEMVAERCRLACGGRVCYFSLLPGETCTVPARRAFHGVLTAE